MPPLTYTARDNPFRVERVLAIRYQPLDTDWPTLCSKLDALGCRAAICGPEGAGKTTLLEDLAQRLQADGRPTHWLQLRRESRSTARRLSRKFLDAASPGDILLVDGAEQLGPLTWRHFRRRARQHAGLVVTTHRPGLLPKLADCRTTVPLLESIVARLVPDDIDDLRGDLPALFARHAGNLRLCLRELYDRYAGCGG